MLGKDCVKLHVARGRQDTAPLLDDGMLAPPAQIPVYHRTQRRITRWEHEHVLEAVQRRLDENPQAMRVRRETEQSAVAVRREFMPTFSEMRQASRRVFR